MKSLKLIQMLALLVLAGAMMFTTSISFARENRKRSSSSSAPKSSSSRQSATVRSPRISSPSRPSISARPSNPAPRTTTRQSGRMSSSRGTRSGGATYSPRIPRSGVNSSGIGGTSGRISRKRDVAPSYQRNASVGGSRVDRRDYSYPGYPTTRRSLYHYHRDNYPSHRIFYWITWPNCCRPICYSWGPSFTFGYFWPYYHRKFIFISLGGYWPGYNYRRYYWYGWHPYYWYGYYPPGYVIAGPTYNYYYYNQAPQGEALGEAQQKLEEKPPSEPAPETRTDRDFDQAVKAFDAGDYAVATQKFHEAMLASPEDVVLPFAHVQALFAGGDYQKATGALRKAMTNVTPEQEGIFYPRGLYSDDSVLQSQIQQLGQVVEENPLNNDLELLLGYQLLGINKYDEAAGHLQHAQINEDNHQAATELLSVLEKLKKTNASSKPVTPDTKP